MKTYLSYKSQIQGIKDVSETVKTVEKIAASSVHFLRQEVLALNSYASEIERVLARLSLFYQKKNHPLLQKRTTGRRALVVLTGDKGLVGGLWHEIVNASLKNIKHYQSVLVLGKKGKNYLQAENMPITHFFDISPQEEGKPIVDYIFKEFNKRTFSQVDILYPQFISLVEQIPNLISFLPFEFKLAVEKNSSEGLPIFEPSKQKIFDNLLQKYIGAFFYKIIMEAKLSEFSARTVAMEYAGVKTKELIQKLILNYTKQRRRIITQRQLESFAAHKIKAFV